MLDTLGGWLLPSVVYPGKGANMHLDSTPLPVAESTVQFAVGDQRLSGAVLPWLESSNSTLGECVPSTLDTIGKFVSLDALDRVALRFALQAGARDLLPSAAVASCLRRPIPGVLGVSVLYSKEYGCAHLGGLILCKSVWMCPVCGAKVSERRREDLSAGVAAWGGSLSLVTLTLQHKLSDPLSALLPVLLGSARALRQGAGWKSIATRASLVGTVRALEVTDGPHGYHPHLHLLCFHDCPTGAAGDVVRRFEQGIQARWVAVVGRLGGVASKLAIDVRSATAEVAAYVAKFQREPRWTVAHELAKSGSKNARGSGRSLAALLRDYVFSGDVLAGDRWRSAVLALKGANQIRWSAGLRELLLPGTVEKTDEELAEEQDDTAVLLALLSLAEWRAVVANDARAELLAVATFNRIECVREFIAKLL